MTTEISKRFEYQRPSADAVARIEKVRAKCKELAELIHEVCPPCRETSLAITKLEEASMWANKGLVFNLPGPQDNG